MATIHLRIGTTALELATRRPTVIRRRRTPLAQWEMARSVCHRRRDRRIQRRRVEEEAVNYRREAPATRHHMRPLREHCRPVSIRPTSPPSALAQLPPTSVYFCRTLPQPNWALR